MNCTAMMRSPFLLIVWIQLLFLGPCRCEPRSVSDCSGFATSMSMGNASRILNATFYPVNSLNVSNTFNSIAICQLLCEVKYATYNSVQFELWLPDSSDYNSRLVVVGNGGMAGTIAESDMIDGLNGGYAVAGGDSGHRASENNGGSGAPGVYLPYMHDLEQINAWIHNSIAYFTPVAKHLVREFYDQPPKYSYYTGCSTGGAQGFANAQYHPELFDGIVAACPGNWYSHLALSFLWNAQQTRGSSFLPQHTLDLITQSALAECDTIDGVEDGVIENPLLCDFDVSSLECNTSRSKSPACLTTEQVAAVKKINGGPKSVANTSLYPGFPIGGETEWMGQEGSLADAFTIPILQNMVFDNLTYDATTFNWGSDVDLVNEKVGKYIDEISPDLSAFKAAGGKMIVLQSWADPYNAPLWPIRHLETIEQTFGGDVGDWFRLFMVPGGGHCGPASNYPHVPAKWHSLKSLVHWIEEGQAPTQILSSDPSDGSNVTRKLCPWPKTAKYLGQSIDSWTSFECS